MRTGHRYCLWTLLLPVLALPVHAQAPLPYSTYTNFDQIVEGTQARYPALTRISDPATNGPRAYTGFFFYQALQFDATGRYALGMRVNFEGREVEPGDRGEIGFVDHMQKKRGVAHETHTTGSPRLDG